MDLTIFTGRQTEEELKDKHPEEYQRLVATGELSKYQTAPPPRWLNNFGRLMGGMAVAAGIVMLVLMAIAFVRE
jgi:hypothetical protein